jgi:hypothetical protein
LEKNTPRKSYLPTTFAKYLYRRGQTPILQTFLALFETLRPNSQETAQNLKKRVLQKGIRITIYNFLKKRHNRGTLLYK